VTDLSTETRSFLRGIDANSPHASAPAAAAFEDENGVSSPNSTVSSISGKRSEREGNGDENDGVERASCSRGGGSDDDDGGGCGGDGDSSRKKLRLSKEQSMLLEETFKEHNTLNPVSLL
jgi:homeobox-leucine zipper protein